ncbi:hypothetical protein ACLOJK_040482 [Asimina triloba]
MSVKIVIMHRWNVAGALHRPNDIRRNANVSYGHVHCRSTDFGAPSSPNEPTIVDRFQSMQIRWSKLSKSETPKSDLNSTSRPNQHGQQGGPAITTRPIRAACPGPAPQAQIRRLMSMAPTSRTQPQQ